MPQINMLLSDDQLAAIDAVRGNLSRSDFIRQCLQGTWERAGREWPQGVGQWGGLRKGAFGIDQLDIDRADVKLLGLPPLADDD